MAALEKAISTGIDMVEIDVQQLKDGHLILLHDNSFGRTTGEKNMCGRLAMTRCATMMPVAGLLLNLLVSQSRH